MVTSLTRLELLFRVYFSVQCSVWRLLERGRNHRFIKSLLIDRTFFKKLRCTFRILSHVYHIHTWRVCLLKLAINKTTFPVDATVVPLTGDLKLRFHFRFCRDGIAADENYFVIWFCYVHSTPIFSSVDTSAIYAVSHSRPIRFR